MITALQSLISQEPVVRQSLSKDAHIQRILLLLMFVGLGTTIILPVIELLKRAMQNTQGEYIGAENFITYFSSPSLFQSAVHTLSVASITMILSVSLAFLFAYAIERKIGRAHV